MGSSTLLAKLLSGMPFTLDESFAWQTFASLGLFTWLVYVRTYCVPIATSNQNRRSRKPYLGDAQINSFRRKFFHAYWALHVNDGFEVYQIRLISIMTTDDPDIIRFRWSEIWGIKSLAWLRVTFLKTFIYILAACFKHIKVKNSFYFWNLWHKK